MADSQKAHGNQAIESNQINRVSPHRLHFGVSDVDVANALRPFTARVKLPRSCEWESVFVFTYRGDMARGEVR